MIHFRRNRRSTSSEIRTRDKVAEASYDSRVDTERASEPQTKEPVMSEPITYV